MKKSLSVPTEHQEHIAFVQWFRAKYPKVLIYAIPNGEKRSITVAKRLKLEGVLSGIPDLHIPAWNLWVEMKRTKGGSLSHSQKDVIEYLETIGHTVIVGKGAKDASEKIIEFTRD